MAQRGIVDAVTGLDTSSDMLYNMRCMVERTKMLNVRVTDDEDRMVKALAEHHGLSISDIIRQYIRRAFAEAFPPKRPKK